MKNDDVVHGIFQPAVLNCFPDISHSPTLMQGSCGLYTCAWRNSQKAITLELHAKPQIRCGADRSLSHVELSVDLMIEVDTSPWDRDRVMMLESESGLLQVMRMHRSLPSIRKRMKTKMMLTMLAQQRGLGWHSLDTLLRSGSYGHGSPSRSWRRRTLWSMCCWCWYLGV